MTYYIRQFNSLGCEIASHVVYVPEGEDPEVAISEMMGKVAAAGIYGPGDWIRISEAD